MVNVISEITAKQERKIQNELNIRLFNAIRHEDPVMVERAISDGAEPNVPARFFGESPTDLARRMKRRAQDPISKDTYAKIIGILEEAVRNVPVD